MSFSSKVKEELARRDEPPKHCMIAQIAAMTSFCGEYDGRSFKYRSENQVVLKSVSEYLMALFPGYKDKIRVIAGGIDIENKELAELILLTVKWKRKGEEAERVFAPPILLKNDCCRKAFIRGAFICAGSVNDPKGAYHLEIVCATKADAATLEALMCGLGLDVKTAPRKKKFIAYMKDGAGITDTLNMMGAYVAQMEFYNAMILKDMRNEVNRRVNCETANLNKTVSAAVKQKKDIEFIRNRYGLDVLGESLKQTALLRLKNPESSLKDLGEMSDPQLGRSGINHRLKAISRFADEHRA